MPRIFISYRREDSEHVAGDPPPKAHRGKGDKANKKRMAVVGALYSVGRHVRTPEGSSRRCSATRACRGSRRTSAPSQWASTCGRG
jgi:hypothetical protein